MDWAEKNKAHYKLQTYKRWGYCGIFHRPTSFITRTIVADTRLFVSLLGNSNALLGRNEVLILVMLQPKLAARKLAVSNLTGATNRNNENAQKRGILKGHCHGDFAVC